MIRIPDIGPGNASTVILTGYFSTLPKAVWDYRTLWGIPVYEAPREADSYVGRFGPRRRSRFRHRRKGRA